MISTDIMLFIYLSASIPDTGNLSLTPCTGGAIFFSSVRIYNVKLPQTKIVNFTPCTGGGCFFHMAGSLQVDAQKSVSTKFKMRKVHGRYVIFADGIGEMVR